MTVGHGCARVAHCVTARWRNFSHYCRPLRHYDVWLSVLITEKHWQPPRQHTVYRNKRLEFATEQVGKLRYVTAVDGGLKRFPWVARFAHPCCRGMFMCRGCEGNVIYERLIVLLYSTRWHWNARRRTGFQIRRTRSRSWREHVTIWNHAIGPWRGN